MVIKPSKPEKGFFRIAKLDKEKDIRLIALNHNKRVKQSKKELRHIDESKSWLNYSLHNHLSADEINRWANTLIAEAGCKVQANTVPGIELLFSLPITRHQQNTKPFFRDCYQWTLKTFEGVLLSFDVHLDESAPHAHALILPLRNGKMQGNDICGFKPKIRRYRETFFNQVGVKHNLVDGSSKRLSRSEREELSQEVVDMLRRDVVCKSNFWPVFLEFARNKPDLFFNFIGANSKAVSQGSNSPI